MPEPRAIWPLPRFPCLREPSTKIYASIAQQAAERALKAVYQHHGKRFRYTHDLEDLISGLRNGGVPVPAEIDDAALLTTFASEARYPSLIEPVTDDEYREAIAQTETVVNWARRFIRGW